MDDLGILKELGDIAGVPGIALGVTLLLLKGVIANTLKLESDQAFRLLRYCTIGALAIGAFGIAASTFAPEGTTNSYTTRGADSPIVEEMEGPVPIKIENAIQSQELIEHERNKSAPAETIPERPATTIRNATTTHGANSPIVKDTKGGVTIQIGPPMDRRE